MSVFYEIKLHWRRLRWPIAILTSALMVAVICKLDSSRQRSNETTLALRWARQMATQAETLSLSASERGEIDPLAWAARILSQGTDSRIIFAQKFRTPDDVSQQSSEHFEFDSDAGVLDYTKVLFPEDSTGIRIKLYVARTSIFGAKTLLAQDLTIAALFAVFLSLFIFVTKEAQTTVVLPPPFLKELPPVAEEPPSKDWMAGFKQALVELGKDVREMTRSAQKLSSSALTARQEIAAAKVKLDLIGARVTDTNEMAHLASEAQVLFATANPETKALLRKLLQVTLKKAAEADQMKKKVDEASANTTAAFDALKDVSDHTKEMSAGITKTTSGVMAVRRSAS
jgi:hypothetical protein